MAIFHYTIKIVGRSKGKSVISASASLFFLPSDTCLLLCFRRLVIIYYKDDKSSENP